MPDPKEFNALLNQHFSSLEALLAAIHLFIYRYIVSTNHSTINFADLARLTRVSINTVPEIQEASKHKEEQRFSAIDDWSFSETLKSKLGLAITHLCDNQATAKNISVFFNLVEIELNSGTTIATLLTDLKSRFAQSLPSGLSNAYSTPPDIVKNLVSLELENTNTESVFDPSCKSGDLLAAAVNQASSESINVHGIEIDHSAGLLAEALLRTQWTHKSSQKLSIITHESGEKMPESNFDFVLSNPPFGKLDTRNVSEAFLNSQREDSRLRSELAFLMYGLSKLKPNGKAAFVLPTIILESDKYIDLRRTLLEQFKLHAVVLLPVDVFQHARVSTSVLLFDLSREDDTVLFVDTTDLAEKILGQDSFPDDAIQIILNSVRNRKSQGNTIGKTIKIEKVLSNTALLNPKLYLTKQTSISDELLRDYQSLHSRYHEQLTELHRLNEELNQICNTSLENER